MVSQIVLQRNGRDPDLVNFRLDVEALTRDYARADDIEQLNATVRDLQGQVRDTVKCFALWCQLIIVCEEGAGGHVCRFRSRSRR